MAALTREPEELARLVVAGDRRAIARAISWVEDEHPAAAALVAAIWPHVGRAMVVGLTGPPGAGKSTLLGALVREVRRRGCTVGVVAVDPSSPFSQGAVLGDRVRLAVGEGPLRAELKVWRAADRKWVDIPGLEPAELRASDAPIVVRVPTAAAAAVLLGLGAAPR